MVDSACNVITHDNNMSLWRFDLNSIRTTRILCALCVHPHSGACFGNTAEERGSVAALMSRPQCAGGQEDNLPAHVHLLHNLVAMLSCARLSGVRQTRPSEQPLT